MEKFKFLHCVTQLKYPSDLRRYMQENLNMYARKILIQLASKFCVIAIAISMSSCSTTSQIQKVSESESHFKGAVYEGQDFYIADEEAEGEQYRIFHQASTGFSGTSGIRNSATIRAQKFCRGMEGDKVMFKVSEHTAKPPYILGNFPRIEIIFVCRDREQERMSTQEELHRYDQLAKLKALLDSGAITKEEFEIEKKKLLSK